MQPRLNAHVLNPEPYRRQVAMEKYLSESPLDATIKHLVKIRASQINGCAYCIDMHSKDARAAGETEQRLYGLSAWREAPYYTDRERAALEWTEAVTLLTEGHVPDDVFNRVRQHFTDKELVELNFAVIVINAYNRIAVPFRTVAGTYQRAAM